MDSPRNGPCKLILGGIVAGVVLVGVLAYAMTVTDSRPFCASCHAMQEAAVTHKMSTHANLSCNDCHAPHALAAKLPFKAREGIRDFLANMGGGDRAASVSVGTRDMVNANCISCHTPTNVNVASMDAKPYCVDCHRNMAHMRHKPISARMVAHE